MNGTANAKKRCAVTDHSDGMLWAARAACSRAPLVTDGELGCDDLAELRWEILDRMAASSGSHPSLNVGGWRTGEELFSWPARAVRTLEDAVRRHLGGASYLAGWAMVNARGSHHPRHRHAMSTVSGICYIDPGDPLVPTIFEASGRPGDEIHVMPVAGRIVLFAGDMWHRVPPYDGTEPRITIAFDARR